MVGKCQVLRITDAYRPSLVRDRPIRAAAPYEVMSAALIRTRDIGIGGAKSPAADDLFYVGGCMCNVLMLPDSEHSPPQGAQMSIRLTIPLDVPGEFGCPPRAVGGGRGLVLGTAVPEAPVDEHHDSGASKQDVRTSTGQPGKRGVDAVAQTSSVELASEEHFGLRVASSLTGHASGGSDVNGRRGNRRDRHGVSSQGRLT
jgi:hypothetical protein